MPTTSKASHRLVMVSTIRAIQIWVFMGRASTGKGTRLAFLEQLATVTGELAGWPCGAVARIGALVGCGATAAEVRKQFEVARPLAETTVPVALWAFAAGAPTFEERVGLAASVGGDVDTVCAMTGALCGCAARLQGVASKLARSPLAALRRAHGARCRPAAQRSE